MAIPKISLAILLCLMAMSKTAISQNCGCAPNLCCSRFGYCGTGDPYCGDGCQQGPCTSTGGGGGSLSSILTQSFFDYIINQADNSCVGKRFYTRNSFLSAANTFPDFTRTVNRREVAAMFAHFTHETGHFCYIEEINGASRDYCDENNREFPCAPGKGYFGRGPIQLSWNYNYGACGRDLGLNLLAQPERVAQDPTIAFRTALWFWMRSVRPVLNQGFGATIRAINGAIECNGGNPGAVQARVRYYRDYCGRLGVDPGPNLTC
ncbi:PREDICTED: basic endochitinase CHB4-like [Tarenaya hassleriana]|uniref:basic endochitinase CHB4-like n=1 Tax=Tarenaya hassleriana TaxID=28532 RepID=UPI00053C3B4A|nr:PREDICTED: basic endochitinase CHB4-like [Tarenaya hassleriana]